MKRKHAKKKSRSLNFSTNLSEVVVRGDGHRRHSVKHAGAEMFALLLGTQVMSPLKHC